MTRTVDDLDGGAFEVLVIPPIAATECRICRAADGRTICRACLYGTDEDTPEEREVYETIWGTIEPQEQETNG